MKFDDKNNIVEVCLFESFLAKYFIDNSDIFNPLLDRIATAIESFITKHENNEKFDRLYFTIFSSMIEYKLQDFNAVKASRCLITWDTFLKYFMELLINEERFISSEHPASFFKKKAPSLSEMRAKMRPQYLFSEEHRGVKELKSSCRYKSHNMGILSISDTPPELINLLKFKNTSSRGFYEANEESNTANWLREHYLPVISGVSGGIGLTVAGLTSLMSLSSRDYQLLGLLVASSTIALGHHSFFEVLKPLSFINGDLEEKDTLLEFYEQVIPEDIKMLESYKTHMSGTHGAVLLEECDFEYDLSEDDSISLSSLSFSPP
ncbi:hypothetical protein [uncultured Legionella sp.]|uniref:hypothetical protein n=1 Tax=uncultured Legionella sp. TaxID=210934 RepID=UPI002628B6B2|nr:hypothetical protein [uncultured Legionella sp.]